MTDRPPSLDYDEDDNAKVRDGNVSEELPYGDTEKFRTWHKHVRDFYQTNMFIDTTWSSQCCQFLPYRTLTQRKDTIKQTILTGTVREDGQNFIQLLDTSLPATTRQLAENGLSQDSYEVGGYGVEDVTRCGVTVNRRMFHNGMVLACRYMPANPTIIASSSSDGNCYVFDISKCSLSNKPNDSERPKCRYPPKKLPDEANEEQKKRHQEKTAAYHTAMSEMEEWDKRMKGKGQHQLTLTGNDGPGVTLDWCMTSEGIFGCGSDSLVAYWKIADLQKPKDKEKEAPLEPFHKAVIGALINDVKFSFFDPHRSMIAADDGTVSRCDVRQMKHDVVARKEVARPATLAMSPLNDVALAVGGTDGVLRIFDQRNMSKAVVSMPCHNGEVGPVSWSPFVEGYIATGGQDGLCTLLDAKSGTQLFKHAGHVESIRDIDWSWQERSQGQIMTCDQNAVTIWKPRNVFWTP